MKFFLLLLFSILLPSGKAVAANTCPWLTSGSGAKALGGAVLVTVQVSGPGEGFCTFARTDTATATLRIVVQKAATDSCPPGSPKLTGVGNEAVKCVLKRPGNSSEMVVGRVREMHFSLTITRPSARNAEGKQADSMIEQVAEQVAGNLF